jgi:hypothetical protein
MTVSSMSSHNLYRDETNLRVGWWLEVGTLNPLCIYFFGPFEGQMEAEAAKRGFFEDLEREDARILYFNVKFCQPRKLTIFADEVTIPDLQLSSPSFFEALIGLPV